MNCATTRGHFPAAVFMRERTPLLHWRSVLDVGVAVRQVDGVNLRQHLGVQVKVKRRDVLLLTHKGVRGGEGMLPLYALASIDTSSICTCQPRHLHYMHLPAQTPPLLAIGTAAPPETCSLIKQRTMIPFWHPLPAAPCPALLPCPTSCRAPSRTLRCARVVAPTMTEHMYHLHQVGEASAPPQPAASLDERLYRSEAGAPCAAPPSPPPSPPALAPRQRQLRQAQPLAPRHLRVGCGRRQRPLAVVAGLREQGLGGSSSGMLVVTAETPE